MTPRVLLACAALLALTGAAAAAPQPCGAGLVRSFARKLMQGAAPSKSTYSMQSDIKAYSDEKNPVTIPVTQGPPGVKVVKETPSPEVLPDAFVVDANGAKERAEFAHVEPNKAFYYYYYYDDPESEISAVTGKPLKQIMVKKRVEGVKESAFQAAPAAPLPVTPPPKTAWVELSSYGLKEFNSRPLRRMLRGVA
ncbi:MAG: hypothetical protein J3K34DRAFT_484906 [Monoraphidium minutum]|nr:MAG: hypothetical protein J3K34DRAFT_484906 [Monoraphidium minutum]